jgi:hypothetical protein
MAGSRHDYRREQEIHPMTAQPGQPLTRGSIYGPAASRPIDTPQQEHGTRRMRRGLPRPAPVLLRAHRLTRHLPMPRPHHPGPEPASRRLSGNGFLAPAGCLALTRPHTNFHLAASGAGSTTGWLAFSSGVVLGALAIVVAVVIAWRQRVIQLRDRAADRALENARQREHEAYEERVAQREMWGAEYDAIRKLLERGEELAYRVRNDGPCTAADFNALDVATFRMNAERLADRGVERLRDPLLRLASIATALTQNAVPDQAVLMTAYAQDQVPKDLQLHVIQRQAILQDRTARDLTEQITCTWHALRAEWGS